MTDFTVKHAKDKEREAIADQIKAAGQRLDNLIASTHGQDKIELTDAKYYVSMTLSILKRFK